VARPASVIVVSSRPAGGAGLGAAAIVLASLMWGTTGTAASFMPDEVPPLSIGAVTMGIGGVVLFLVFVRRSVTVIRDRSALPWLLIGAAGVVVYPLAFYPAMALAGVAIGNVVSLGSGPVFAALLEWVVDRRRPGVAWLLATIGAVVGIVLLAIGGHGESAHQPVAVVPGIALGLLAGIAYASYTFASGRTIQAGHTSTGVMGSMFGLGAIALIPVLLVCGGPILDTPAAIGISAYLVLGPMVLAYVLFGFGMRTLTASTVTVITLIEPAVATALAVIVVGERLEPLAWFGLVLLVAAVVVVAIDAIRKHPGEPALPRLD